LKVPDAHDHAEAELQAKLAAMTEKEAIALGKYVFFSRDF
jgi:hypothetical protein